ncbi:MAG: filamentous hemagglutinin N-terminal domain-containing protein [Proteobacteria bacterium]|nr:filamentous hemagglutinin N-terminal domain-containing protein [Pseudomonadota bacterium]
MKHTAIALALAAAWGTLHAAAVTDGTMGAVQSLSGNFTVPQSLGTLRGGNLFHSFGSFSILAGESATFLSGAAVNNVIARVTGSQASLLQGLLALKAEGGARPDFFLLNPRGIVVTAGASFDLPAGLHLSTASQLRFADGSTWSTGGSSPSSLSVAAPESFGFLGGEAALRWRDAGLHLAAGSTLELAGGSGVTVDNALLLAPGGWVRVQSPGTVALTNGGLLAANAPTADAAGRIDIAAQDLSISGGANGLRTGLVSQTGAAAQGGGITIKLSGSLAIDGGGEITNQGASAVANGATRIEAGSVTISADADRFSSVFAQGLGSAPGPAIGLSVAGLLDLRGGDISSAAGGSGAAGAIDIGARAVRLDGLGLTGYGGINAYGNSGAPGAVSVAAATTLELLNGARIASSNRSGGEAGAISVLAQQALFDGQAQTAAISSANSGSGRGADVLLAVGDRLTLAPGGQVSAYTLGSGAAGDVRVAAARIEAQGNHEAGYVTGIFDSSLAAQAGPGGTVSVLAGRIALGGDAAISTSTLDSAAGAGTVRVQADELLVDGQGRAGGIQSFAYGGQGPAGTVLVDITGKLSLLDGGSIIAGTLGSGDPGAIAVRAGSVLIDGSRATQVYTGIGGDALGFGAGASVAVQAGRIDILQGGSISSATNSSRDAGNVLIQAGTLRVDGGGNTATSTGISTTSGSRGAAGNLVIEADHVEVLAEGLVSSSAIGAGRGGALRISADTITLAGGGTVASVAAGSGDAGPVELQARGAVSLADGGIVAASSGGSGAAGRVSISAGTLTLGGSSADGQRSRIVSRALPGSAGDAGSIAITVDGAFTMAPDSLISIANDAQVAPGAGFAPSFVRVQAGSIALSGAEISAASSRNADAGAIALRSGGALSLSNSLLQTTAHDGQGGPIALDAAGIVRLHNAMVTTSVDGTAGGDGGNIRIAGQALVLQSGFVQANTVASQASGGTVTIAVPLLVPDGSKVFIGGNRIAQFRADTPGYNVIQAAAPNGLAGTLDVTTPDLNLSGQLAALSTARIDFGLLGRDQCQVGFDSSFTPLGRGALPEAAAEPLRAPRR